MWCYFESKSWKQTWHSVHMEYQYVLLKIVLRCAGVKIYCILLKICLFLYIRSRFFSAILLCIVLFDINKPVLSVLPWAFFTALPHHIRRGREHCTDSESPASFTLVICWWINDRFSCLRMSIILSHRAFECWIDHHSLGTVENPGRQDYATFPTNHDRICVCLLFNIHFFCNFWKLF